MGGNHFNISYLTLEYNGHTENGQRGGCGGTVVVLMKAFPVDLQDCVTCVPDIRKFSEKDTGGQWEPLSPASRQQWPMFGNPWGVDSLDFLFPVTKEC